MLPFLYTLQSCRSTHKGQMVNTAVCHDTFHLLRRPSFYQHSITYGRLETFLHTGMKSLHYFPKNQTNPVPFLKITIALLSCLCKLVMMVSTQLCSTLNITTSPIQISLFPCKFWRTYHISICVLWFNISGLIWSWNGIWYHTAAPYPSTFPRHTWKHGVFIKSFLSEHTLLDLPLLLNFFLNSKVSYRKVRSVTYFLSAETTTRYPFITRHRT